MTVCISDARLQVHLDSDSNSRENEKPDSDSSKESIDLSSTGKNVGQGFKI